MMTKEDNDLLTRVEGDAPMGRMLRERYWIPFLRAERAVAGGAPVKVRLVGSNYVVFRAHDGRLGFFDEGCPHRQVSLALARNEDNSLVCIFHGWKMHVSGKVVEAPTECRRAAEFASKVPLRHYPVREAGGLLWVWLGAGEGKTEPRFPDFEFTTVPADQVWTSYTAIDCNWMQGLEVTVDSSHISHLHKSWAPKLAGYGNAVLGTEFPPRYECQQRPYGVRTAALRELPDGSCYARVGEFVMPFYGFVGSTNAAAGERTLFISVPIDDAHSILFFVRYTLQGVGPYRGGPGFELDTWDPDNFAPVPGSAEQVWGQDRELMAKGHFTGFGSNLVVEDIVVQVSMGPIVDRTREFLSASDAGIVQVRKHLLRELRDFSEGCWSREVDDSHDYASVRGDSRTIPDSRWKEHFGG